MFGMLVCEPSVAKVHRFRNIILPLYTTNMENKATDVPLCTARVVEVERLSQQSFSY